MQLHMTFNIQEDIMIWEVEQLLRWIMAQFLVNNLKTCFVWMKIRKSALMISNLSDLMIALITFKNIRISLLVVLSLLDMETIVEIQDQIW